MVVRSQAFYRSGSDYLWEEKDLDNHRQVLVIGAGPVGLTAALALRKQGLPATVVEGEPKGRQRPGSRAIYIHKATLKFMEEIYPGLGFTLKKAGVIWPVKRTLWKGRNVYYRKYSPPKPDQLPPFTSLPQVEIESYLYEACKNAGVEFVWNTSVKKVQTDSTGVKLTMENGDIWNADYVIACDGARSTVRRQVGIEMEGPRAENTFLVVDVKEDEEQPLPLERIFHYHHPAVGGRNVLYVPFAGGWRIDLQLFDEDDPKDYGGKEGVKKWLPKVMDPKYAERVTWVSTYKFLQVVAKSFTDENRKVMLAGEAAHLFAPFGARGMNSGVPDAIFAARAIQQALQESDKEKADQIILKAAEERRKAAQYNRDAAGTALHHLQGRSPGIMFKRLAAATFAPLAPKLGRWLDEGPYGPRSGPKIGTKY